MKLRYILLITTSLTLIIVMYNLLIPKPSPYVVNYDKKELTWIEENNSSNIFYYVSAERPEFINDIIVTLGLLLNIDFVETSDLDLIKSKNGILVSMNSIDLESIETRTIYTKLYGIYSNDLMSDFNQNETYNLGILKKDAEHIDFESKYNYFNLSYFDTEEELMKLVSQGTLDYFAISNDTPLIYHDVYGAYKLKEKLYSTNENLRFILDSKQAILKSILNKNIDYMIQHETIENIKLNNLFDNQRIAFQKMMTDEEKNWLIDRDTITVGIEEHSPEAIKKDNVLYGVTIGIMNQIGRLTDKNIEYIYGKYDKLVAESSTYDIDIIWSANHQNSFTKSIPFIQSDYIVVGAGNNVEIKSKYDLQQYKVGILFNSNLSTELSKILGNSNITYYKTEYDLIAALESNVVDVIVTSKIILDYYETIIGLDNLDIRYTFTDHYYSSLLLLNEEPILESIINKIILVQDLDKLESTSFSNIPLEEDTILADWKIIVIFLLVLLVIIGLFVGKYYQNYRERKQMNYLFTHDQMTHLPNKYGIKQHVNALIEKEKSVSFLLIDIDNFKDINDRLGQLYGDQVIVEYSQKLLGVLETFLILGRSAGDEFVLVSPTITDEEVTDLVKTVKMYTEMFQNEKSELYSFTVSISITKYPEHGSNYDDLYKYAEYTLEHIKSTYGDNSELLFTYDIYDSYVQEQLMIKEIKQGIQNGEFELYIQPQILLPSEEVFGGEILIRWNHPTKGLVYPNTFIPVAEKNGLMRELDYYVLFHSCMKIKQWESLYHTFKVSVNMSTTTFEDDSLIRNLKDYISNIGFDTSWLTIEVVEDMGFYNMERANDIFIGIRDLGISVALDDFGKGYSSLAYLEKLKFDILKIDKTLIDNIHTKEKSYEIFKAITRLAEIMDIKVVAEGVEYQEQVLILNERLNIIAQGYYYSKPIKLKAFELYIQNKKLN